MKFNLQPILENSLVKLSPLKESDFAVLYEVASDPLIWEQHPNKNRYQLEVFKTFFQGALESKGAFCIFDQATSEVIGSTRFYYIEGQEDAISVGYTFFRRSHWGRGFNQSAKSLMLAHASGSFTRVLFQVGAENIRSQVAMERLGAVKIGEEVVAYYGEPEKLNYLYSISLHCKNLPVMPVT